MNYDEIIEDCVRRMDRANVIAPVNSELSHEIWWNTYNRYSAALAARLQSYNMRYTTGLPADLRIEHAH